MRGVPPERRLLESGRRASDTASGRDRDPHPVVGCAGYASFFPAFVYTFGNKLFLSNAAGDCSIAVHEADEAIGGYPSNISFRLFSDPEMTGAYTGKIMLLEFEVRDGELLTPVPMSPRLLVVEPDDWGNLYAPDLSPDGTRFIASIYAPDGFTRM